MKGLRRSLARGAPQTAPVVKKHIPINADLSFTGVTDTVVAKQAVIGDFPQGNILLLGAVAYLTLTGPTSADLANDFEGDFAIGTAPNADTDLSDATDFDIIPATQIPAAANEVAGPVRATHTVAVAGTVYDNTDGSLELNLNVLLDANEVTNAKTVVIKATGSLDIAYIVLGDD
jgi:hypothetical protein